MITGRTVWELIERRSHATPDEVMLVDEAGRKMTFGEYLEGSERVAAGLISNKISPGTVVTWQLPTRIETIVLMGALSRLNVVQSPLLPIYRAREIRFIVSQTKSSVLIVPSTWKGFDYYAQAESVAKEIGGITVLVSDPQTTEGSVDALPDPPVVDGEIPESTVRWLYYTSGTTADQKGARHTDAGLMAAAATQVAALDLDPSDRMPVVFPLAHVGGATTLFSALMSGCRLLVAEVFDPPVTVPFLRREGATLGSAGTAFHLAYLAEQRKQPGLPILPAIRLFVGGGTAKPPQLHLQLKEELGARLVSSYGLTECPVITYLTPGDPEDKAAGSEGRPRGGAEVRIVKEDGRVAEPGEEGEIRVTGPQLLHGYVDPALNAAAFDESGLFRTGDLGYVDADGFLTITGRLKDIIIRKGENISAKELEDLLSLHPKVSEVAVVGLPDPLLGERCCAVVAVRDRENPLRFGEMVTFLKEKELMIQKIPEQMEIVLELPRNASGKVLKRDLVEMFTAE